MANRIQLKSYFETGDKPTQAQFGELIDSLALVTELSSANLATLAQALAGLDNTKAMSPFLVKSVLLDWLINDLTTGGTQKSLSAEQGKVLQLNKASKTFDLDTTQVSTWKLGLAIGKEVVRSGVVTGSTIASVTSALSLSFPNQFYATIPSFSPTTHSVIFSVYVVNYHAINSAYFPATHRLEGQLTHFTDSMLRVQYDYLALSTVAAHYPITPYMSWAVIKH